MFEFFIHLLQFGSGVHEVGGFENLPPTTSSRYHKAVRASHVEQIERLVLSLDTADDLSALIDALAAPVAGALD